MCTKSQTLLSFILVIVLAALSACAPVTDAPSTAPEETSLPQEPVSVAPVAPLDGRLLIPYDKDDSLNPYQATSALNLALHSLVYDSLVKLDNDFTPVMSLASDIDIDGTRCTVTIKNGIHFSDGTPLTAMDVRYSIDCIRLSSSVYANRLSNIAGYSVQDEHTLVITLSSPDSLFVNLLDFPVIQSGTYSSDRPVGNGRYVYDGEPNELDGGEIRLTANDQWHGDDIETFKELSLTPYDYGQSLIYALKSGKINFAFTDLARAQSSTNMGSSPIQIPLTNLVYLGLNNTLGYTATSSFRKAIALCLDRSRIASDAFLSRATASSTPFNPNMYATAELENQLYADPDAANSILDALGYNERDDEGYRLHGVDRLTLSVLVNTENFYRTQTARVVKDNLAAIGVDCAITELSSKNFLAAVQSSEFEMYIGETRLYANNDLSEFFSSGGALSYGGVANSGMPYASLREGQIGYTYFCSTFLEQSPFIPLVFRNGVACFTETMSYNVKSSMSDPFFNIENWTYAQ